MNPARRRPPYALLAALWLAGCQAQVPASGAPAPGTAAPGTAATTAASDPRWAEVATALVLAGRSAEATIRTADRINAGAKARPWHLLQAEADDAGEDDADAGEDDADTGEDDADMGEDDANADDLGDFDDDVQEKAGVAATSDLDEEEWDGWIESEDGDAEWTQAIDVDDDDFAELTGDLEVKDLVDAKGKLKGIDFEYTPDETAKTQGIPAHEIHAKVAGKTAELTVTAGAQSFENVQWGQATFQLHYEALDSGERRFSGQCKTNDGRAFDVSGVAHPDGTNDLTMNSGTMVLVFRGIKEPVDAHGYILDRAPTDAGAQAVGEIQAHRNQPTTIQFWTNTVSYAALVAAPPAPTLAMRAGLPERGLDLAVDASAPWRAAMPAADGAIARQALWSVTPAFKSAHAIAVTEVVQSPMSDAPDRIALVDRTAETALDARLSAGALRLELSDAHGRVAVTRSPDGTYLVDGHAVADARAAAHALVDTEVGAHASIESLAALDFALLSHDMHATRGQLGSNCPPPTVPPRVTSGGSDSYRVLAQGDVPADEALAPLTAVVQAAIALREGR